MTDQCIIGRLWGTRRSPTARAESRILFWTSWKERELCPRSSPAQEAIQGALRPSPSPALPPGPAAARVTPPCGRRLGPRPRARPLSAGLKSASLGSRCPRGRAPACPRRADWVSPGIGSSVLQGQGRGRAQSPENSRRRDHDAPSFGSTNTLLPTLCCEKSQCTGKCKAANDPQDHGAVGCGVNAVL